jgi:Rrf2 family protein
LRLTRAGEYAIRCTLYLASCGRDIVVSRREVARAMEIPEPFLAKVARHLARANIIQIVQGAKGGYRLLVTPEKLSILAVVEAVIGNLVLNDCVLNPRSCHRSPTCSVHQVWIGARDQLRQSLAQATFDKLLDQQTCSDRLLAGAARRPVHPIIN